jgi:Signal transduction histidine kinase regulating C4-dicarboxylate transport system
MNDPSTLDPSAKAILEGLKSRFPDSPFLALGQTALWDEPTKAAFRRALDEVWPDARLIAAAHDTDYFAKLPGYRVEQHEGAKYALVPHDDAATRGLWSAAGEMSRLFGSEDVSDRHRLEATAGVSLHRALYGAEEPEALLSELTAAWGWTGLLHTEQERKIAQDIPLRDILPTLLEQIEWATEGSVECIADARRAARAREVAATLRGWVETFAQNHPEASLTDAYCDLFPRLYALLLGRPASNLSTSSTLRLLRFNTETASLPRFAFADLFLSPITRAKAIDAYNLAVAGTEVYTLDRFGVGALPFDLVIPGQGRGTLRILGDGTVRVDTPVPVTLCDARCNLASIEGLAGLVERELGPDVALVGKAVTLIPMLAAEFFLVFHETASSYTVRTRDVLTRMAESGVPLPALRPIVRVRYHTWDTLEAVPVSAEEGETDVLRLPEFLAQAFGRETISFSHFANCWRYALGKAQAHLEELSRLRSPRDLLAFLAQAEGDGWAAKAQEYESARLRLLSLWNRAEAIQGRVYTLYDQVRRVRAETVALEREKGDDFRARVWPLRERMLAAASEEEAAKWAAQIETLQAERAARYDLDIAGRRSQVRYALATVRELKAERLAIERGPEAEAARETLRRIEAEAERAKARRARNALQAVYGLPHTNYRPSAWWFPLVDASGTWFARLAETAEYSLEPLSPGVPASTEAVEAAEA